MNRLSAIETKQLRVDANNFWPARIAFPVEEELVRLLASHNVATPFQVCPVSNVTDKEFHKSLAFILDGLDALPLRPDRAFESIWVTMDVEMGRIKEKSGATHSRFKAHIDHVSQATHLAGVLEEIVKFLPMAPLQVCEYAARRILDANQTPSEHSERYLKRAKDAIGTDFADAFAAKYIPRLQGVSAEDKSKVQRKAGSLIRKIMKGDTVSLGTQTYGNKPMVRLAIFASVVLPNVRNERFHGHVFPSYRSSAASMKHYVSGLFVCMVTYYLVMASLADRFPVAVSTTELSQTIAKNSGQFQMLFKRFLGA